MAKRPVAFVDDYLPALLGRASALVPSSFHEQVRARGLSVSEWRVLASLADGQAITTGVLAQVSLSKGPTATRLLDRMQAKGHVERLASPDDRRVTLIRITAAGQAIVGELIELARDQEKRVLERFGARESRQLKQELQRLIELQRALESDGEIPEN